MSALSIFRQNFPQLRQQTAHLIWPLTLHFWFSSYKFYRRIAAEEKERAALPHVGDASKRNECCGARPSSYGKTKLKDIPGLPELLVPRGTGLLGWNKYFECRVCGQS